MIISQEQYVKIKIVNLSEQCGAGIQFTELMRGVETTKEEKASLSSLWEDAEMKQMKA